jgi:hypothetical protein
MNPRLMRFFEELKTHPNIPYESWGEGLAKIIPDDFKIAPTIHDRDVVSAGPSCLVVIFTLLRGAPVGRHLSGFRRCLCCLPNRLPQ